jgi:hypothetical protein
MMADQAVASAVTKVGSQHATRAAEAGARKVTTGPHARVRKAVAKAAGTGIQKAIHRHRVRAGRIVVVDATRAVVRVKIILVVVRKVAAVMMTTISRRGVARKVGVAAAGSEIPKATPALPRRDGRTAAAACVDHRAPKKTIAVADLQITRVAVGMGIPRAILVPPSKAGRIAGAVGVRGMMTTIAADAAREDMTGAGGLEIHAAMRKPRGVAGKIAR